MEDKNKPRMQMWQKDVRCPADGTLLGRYDVRIGIVNTTYYCPKCRMEYTFTVRPQKKT